MSEHCALPRTRESVPADCVCSIRLRRRSNAIAVWVDNRTSSVGSTRDDISVWSRTRPCPIDWSLWRDLGCSLDGRIVWIDDDRTTVCRRSTLWRECRTTTTATTAAAGPAIVWAVSIRRDRFALRKLVRPGFGRPSNRDRAHSPETRRPAPSLCQRTEHRIPPRRDQGGVGPGFADEMPLPDVFLQRTAGRTERGDV